jgi:D-3-phosphoglycerate dehydrogenase
MPTVLMSSSEGRNAPIADGLRKNGLEVVVLPPAATPARYRYPTPEELASIWPKVDAFILTGRDMVTREALEAGVNLRMGASWVIGTENIDVPAATDLGICIAFGNVPENAGGVAEAVGMLIPALLKKLPQKWAEVRDCGFKIDDVGRMVRNRTIGLIGLGNVGRGVARRLQGWEARLICSDPYVDPAVAKALNVELVDLDTLLRESDVVSVMVVLTEQTRKMISDPQLALMKPGAYLINTSRGACVDELAVTKALDSGHLAGAALDVWEVEPTNLENPLRAMPNVIATAHNIAHSHELFEALVPAAIENVSRGVRGEEPIYVRNPEVLPAWRERLQRLGVS